MADLYVLNALDQDELHKYISHLDECSNCKERVRELNEIAVYISLYNMNETAPPQGMEERIFSKLPSRKRVFFKKWKRSLIISVAVITCIMLIFAGVHAYSVIQIAKHGGGNNSNQNINQEKQQMNASDDLETKVDLFEKNSNSDANVTNEQEIETIKKRKTNKRNKSIPSKDGNKTPSNKDKSNDNEPPSNKRSRNSNISPNGNNKPGNDKPSNNDKQLKKDKPIKRKLDDYREKIDDWDQEDQLLLAANVNIKSVDISVDLSLRLNGVKK